MFQNKRKTVFSPPVDSVVPGGCFRVVPGGCFSVDSSWTVLTIGGAAGVTFLTQSSAVQLETLQPRQYLTLRLLSAVRRDYSSSSDTSRVLVSTFWVELSLLIHHQIMREQSIEGRLGVFKKNQQLLEPLERVVSHRREW